MLKYQLLSLLHDLEEAIKADNGDRAERLAAALLNDIREDNDVAQSEYVWQMAHPEEGDQKTTKTPASEALAPSI